MSQEITGTPNMVMAYGLYLKLLKELLTHSLDFVKFVPIQVYESANFFATLYSSFKKLFSE